VLAKRKTQTNYQTVMDSRIADQLEKIVARLDAIEKRLDSAPTVRAPSLSKTLSLVDILPRASNEETTVQSFAVSKDGHHVAYLHTGPERERQLRVIVGAERELSSTILEKATDLCFTTWGFIVCVSPKRVDELTYTGHVGSFFGHMFGPAEEPERSFTAVACNRVCLAIATYNPVTNTPCIQLYVEYGRRLIKEASYSSTNLPYTKLVFIDNETLAVAHGSQVWLYFISFDFWKLLRGGDVVHDMTYVSDGLVVQDVSSAFHVIDISTGDVQRIDTDLPLSKLSSCDDKYVCVASQDGSHAGMYKLL
jgi:hypothetical protein